MINTDKIKQLDSQNMLGSIDQLASQVKHAWDAVKQIEVPEHYKECKNIVLFGMGGSALGMDIIKAVYSNQITVPIHIQNDYAVPKFVDKNSLVILSSYSGTTEEVVATASEVAELTDRILVVTTGGKLSELMEEKKYPGYLIEPTFNPCGQPRIAVGYATIGLLGLLNNVGLVKLSDQNIDDVVHFLEGNRELLRDDAMRVASDTEQYIPVYIGSEFLAGNVHVMSNQTNENGKHFSTWKLIPELNHHLLEGLENPAGNTDKIRFIFLESNLYHVRNQKRYEVTKQVLEELKMTYSVFVPTANNELLQSFETLQWGSYLSFYLSVLNNIDPSPIPWVDYFKDALKKP
ncbi:MAG: SIS domain-containing protein [bacterium]|nr:SIS domain-containing protein [bacterium]